MPSSAYCVTANWHYRTAPNGRGLRDRLVVTAEGVSFILIEHGHNLAMTAALDGVPIDELPVQTYGSSVAQQIARSRELGRVGPSTLLALAAPSLHGRSAAGPHVAPERLRSAEG